MTRLRRLALFGLALVASCASARWIPPEPAPAGQATFVSASFDLTWTAALDHLATAGLPIASVDRDAGLIATESVAVDASDAPRYADCGAWSSGDSRDPVLATSVVYEVVVQDDGSSSWVRVAASWDTDDPEVPSCVTKGLWEDEAQEAIRLAAEANR